MKPGSADVAAAAKKAERDNFVFILACLFRAARMAGDEGAPSSSAKHSFDCAEEQVAEAESRGIALAKVL